MLLKKKLHIFNSLETLKILTFWKILQEKNILLLDFDYYTGKKYSNRDKDLIESTWIRLYDEYFILRDDSKSKIDLDKGFKETELISKLTQLQGYYNYLVAVHKLNTMLPKEEVIKREYRAYESIEEMINPVSDKQKENGVTSKKLFDRFGSQEDALKMIVRLINSLQNTYNQYHKKQEKVIKKEISNVYSVVVNAESWMERNLNVEDMNVLHWIEIEKAIITKQKAQKDGK